MKQPWLAIAVSGCACCASVAGNATEPELESILRFEAGATEAGAPVGWNVAPEGTITIDGSTAHAGAGAVLLSRDEESPDRFSRILYRLPVDFDGARVELRGYLRTNEVSESAALWLRADGDAGMIALDNMADRPVRDTTPWSERSVEVRLTPDAKQLVFGVLLSGTGEAWADDLRLFVDGRPLAAVPRRPVVETVLETDHEFDEGSGIEIDTLSARQVEHLAVLGRVWGFLKYHHPRVAGGDLHWDYELFRVLPGVLEAGDARERNNILSQWIERLGVPDHCDPCAAPPQDVHLAPRLDWIRDADVLGPDLSGKLQQIHRHRPSNPRQFYVWLRPGTDNPVFMHELPYRDMRASDSGLRILALYRLWNIIEYWYPYRDLIAEWPAALLEFLPRMTEADERDSYRLEMLALIVRIGDGHANLWSGLDVRPPRGECHLPLDLHFVEDQLVVRAIAGSRPLRLHVGDVVRLLGGQSVDDRVRDWLPYYAGSNDSARMGSLGHFFSRGTCGTSSITVERDRQTLHLAISRTEGTPWTVAHDRAGETFQMLSPEAAYLKLSSIHVRDIDDYLEAAADTRGLVIDIRNYPSEFVPFALGSRLVEARTEFARFTLADLANPGAFRWGEVVALDPDPEKAAYTGKVAILVNETSISQSEYTAMALRAGPRSAVVGSTTAGADGNVSRIALPGGLMTMISGIGVFYPGGTPTQRVGIVPDIVARPTIEGLRAGRDEVLEAALGYILGKDADEAEIRRMALRP